MIPFKYLGFYDVPRCIAVHHGGNLLLLESVFDEKIDDYSDNYSVYVLPDSVEDLLQSASWEFLGSSHHNISAHRSSTGPIVRGLADPDAGTG